MKRLLFLGLMVSCILSAGNVLLSHEKTWPAKRLKHIYPEATKFTSKQVTLTASQIARIQKHEGIKIGVEDKSPTFYFAHRKLKVKKDKKTTRKEKAKSKTIGVIIFIDEYGKNGKMEISVGMSSKGKIDRINLWQHKEDKRITKNQFLDQFKGKGVDFDFHPGHTITLVKGAKKASVAVMRAAQKSLLIMDELYGKKEHKEHEKIEKKEHHEEEGETKEDEKIEKKGRHEDDSETKGHQKEEGESKEHKNDGHHDKKSEKDDHH